MEITKTELVAVEEVAQEVAVAEIRELNELHLALVGGGMADVLVG